MSKRQMRARNRNWAKAILKGFISNSKNLISKFCFTQSEYEAFAEGEAAYEDPNQTFMEIPNELVPVVRELIAKKTALTSNV